MAIHFTSKASRTTSLVQFMGILLPLLLGAIGFLLYWPSLASDLVYDARIEILQEGFLTSLSNLPEIFSLRIFAENLLLGTRPGQLLYLMLIAAFSGKDPFGYHLCSNLLHALNVLLVFILLKRLLSRESVKTPMALLSTVAVTLLFAVHPLSTEAVAEVSYSSVLLVNVFTLIGLLIATSFRSDFSIPSLLHIAGAAFCTYTALACKESGIAVGPLLFVYWFLYRRHEAKGPWLLFIGSSALAALVYLSERFLCAQLNAIPPNYIAGTFSQMMWIEPQLQVYMIGKLLWPTFLSADYCLPDLYLLSTPLSLLILGALVAGQIWLSCTSRMGALGVAIYWLGLASVSNLVPLYHFLADRYYYLPLVGVALQLLSLLLMIKSRIGASIILGLILVILLPLSVLTVARQSVFSSELALWTYTLRVSPSSSTAHVGLGLIYQNNKQYDAAIAENKLALQLNSLNGVALNNWGNCLYKQNRIDEAIVLYKKVLEINPNDPDANNDLGMAYANKKEDDTSIHFFKKILQLTPRNTQAHNNYGLVLTHKGDYDAALAEFQKAVEINPAYENARLNLGNALLKVGRIDEAISSYEKTLTLSPNNADAHSKLGLALAQKNLMEESIVHLQKAISLDPHQAEATYNLGLALEKKGKIDEAIGLFEKALKINPDDADAEYNLGLSLGQKNQVDESILHYQKAIHLDPKMEGAHNNLGAAYYQKGRINDAITEFKEAVRINPENQDAQSNLENLLKMPH